LEYRSDGKRKCTAVLKDDRAKILDGIFFGNNSDGILVPIKRTHNHRTKKCNAVLESTGNMLMRIHDLLKDSGIDTILANPYTIIVQAR
jgi:transposase